MTLQGYQSAPYTLITRRISDQESKAARDSLKPVRYNAMGMSILAIATAVTINFANDAIVILVPLMFAVASAGLVAQFRRSFKAVKNTLTTGTIAELKAIPAKKSMGRGWTVGPVTFARSGELSEILTDGVPASVAFLPETKFALSVNGVALRKPILMVAPKDFGKEPMSQPAAQPQVPVYMQAPVPQPSPPSADDELPPPPDDWNEPTCTKCGQVIPKGALFCSNCGARMGK